MTDKKHSSATARLPNRLADETSTYLQQHYLNPVDWYPWGKEALDKARAENKPILLSIGYAACHWCHVMAHESFEDDATADIMNELFVNIKVDREERTDLDEIYMKAIQLMTGHGGWPMTVFLTPDCKPFFGGTYFPVDDRHGLPGFKRVLKSVNQAWQSNNAQVLDSANELARHLSMMERVKPENAAEGLDEGVDDEGAVALDIDALKELEVTDGNTALARVVNTSTINGALEKILRNFDKQHGGFGGAPKFPHTMTLELAMRAAGEQSPFDDKRKEECLELVQITLDKMAYGGIHDQIGGGFARYSVDRQWLVPHFEKMLYDNALLAKTYFDGYSLTGREYWLRTAERILEFVSRELTTTSGAFYSSLDADSEGEEGKFYVFKPEEVIAVLEADQAGKDSGDGKWFNETFGVTEHGNFEHGTSIFHLRKSPEELSRINTMPLADLWQKIDRLSDKLMVERAKRIRPTRDEKVLTSWNSLMISAFVEGYKATAKEKYLASAIKCADFLIANMKRGDRLMRVWGQPVAKDGEPQSENGIVKLPGCLDDYAYFVEALLNLASVDSDRRWLDIACELADSMITYFRDEKEGGLFFTASDHEELVVRPRSHYDGSVPSGTSVAACALQKLHRLTGKQEYLDLVEEIFTLYGPHMTRMPDQFANLLNAMDAYLANGPEVAVVLNSKQDKEMLFEVHSRFSPNKVVAVSRTGEQNEHAVLTNRKAIDDKTTVFICRNFACDKPINDIDELKAKLSKGH